MGSKRKRAVIRYKQADGNEKSEGLSVKKKGQWQDIYLNGKEIIEIDLTPFASVPSLRLLDLSNNMISNIDLSPLSNCVHLKELRLQSNQIETIDILPLASCKELRKIDLSMNQLQEFDSSSLCARFPTIKLNGNNLDNLDVTPMMLGCSFELNGQVKPYRWISNRFVSEGAVYQRWHMYRKSRILPSLLREIQYQKQLLWKPIQKLLTSCGSRIRIQHVILSALDLEDIGIPDADISYKIMALSEDLTLEAAREAVEKIVVDAMIEQINHGGSSIGLDITKYYNKYGGIASRISKIEEARRKEIESVEVYRYNRLGTTIDLRPLWLTAYGYSILSSLDMEATTFENDLKKIVSAFKDINLELRVVDTDDRIANVMLGYVMSSEMAKQLCPKMNLSDEYILHIIWLASRNDFVSRSRMYNARTGYLYSMKK